MAGNAGAVVLALDQNFPQPILDALAQYMPDIHLEHLSRIDRRLGDLEDHELVVALYQAGYEGLVTNNYKMLNDPRVLVALMKTKLTVFAIEGAGDDPIRATGAVFLDLPGAISRRDPSKPHVFWLRPRNPQPQDAWDLFGRAAERRHSNRQNLYDELKLSDDDIAQPVLDTK
jgi:hypothetical protein